MQPMTAEYTLDNPKHKEPWQRGRRGSLCGPVHAELARQLFESSVLVNEKRYATHDGRAYCAKGNEADIWHGWLVGWKEVPEPLRRQWVGEGIVKRRAVMRFWDGDEE